MITLALAVLLAAEVDPNPWETQATEPFLIKTRARAGSDVKEVWAEATLDAAPADIQDALTDVTRYTSFMPYMSEARLLEGRDADGAQYTYQKIEPPLLSARDFVHKVYLDRDARTDPEGVFKNHWAAAPDKLPRVDSVIRLEISEGSWRVQPLPGGKSYVVYRLCVDPAGAVPAFAANRANTSGLTDTFKNIEREAQRRAAARKAAR